tara:strand:+ start:83 stop:343 length:261 start_codon:yes stop_codon:yes gene_type:complete
MRTPLNAHLALLSCLLMAGCDPLVNVEGAYFPSWLVSGLAGVVGSVIIHVILLKIGLEKHLILKPLTYLALFILLTFLTWMVLYAA